MNTGIRCCVCTLPILTNQVIVGFPVIRIIGIQKSIATGDEILAHANCFTEVISHKPAPILQLNGKG